MREINILKGYPSPKEPRMVSENLRTISHRLVASKRDESFFDGQREFGYGGFKYDGRWKKIASNIISTYSFNQSEKILQIYIRSTYHAVINTLLILLFIFINTVCSVNTIVNSGKVYNIISAIFSIVMWFPQIYMTYRLKTAHSLSLIALTVHSLGCFATVIYQRFLLHQNWLVIANYIIGGLSEGFIVCLIMYYRKCNYSTSNEVLNMNLFSNIETTL